MAGLKSWMHEKNGRGYHFLISREGEVYQMAPLSNKTAHIKPGGHNMRGSAKHLSNSNSIGISMMNTDVNLGNGRWATKPSTPRQLRSFQTLVSALKRTYPSIKEAYGHGEIQGDREDDEGLDAAKLARSLF